MSGSVTPWPNTTDDRLATTGHKGLMSKADKAKLDKIVSTYARVGNNAAIATTSGGDTTLTFNTNRYISITSMHSTTTNTSRLVAPVEGWYDMGAAIRWDANATGYRGVYITLNGITTLAREQVQAANGAATWQFVATQYYLAATHYIEIVVNQGSGGALNVGTPTANANAVAEAWLTLLAAA